MTLNYVHRRDGDMLYIASDEACSSFYNWGIVRLDCSRDIPALDHYVYWVDDTMYEANRWRGRLIIDYERALAELGYDEYQVRDDVITIYS